MRADRRLITLVVTASLLALPALVLRIACVGPACEEGGDARAADVPFCSLPPTLRGQLVSGYREGRSPEVLAAAATNVVGATGFGRGRGPAWPGAHVDARVPLFIAGTGVADTSIPQGTTLDAVAPTLSEIIGLNRPHPEVRSGEAIEGVGTGEHPRLIVLMVASGFGSADLEEHPEGAALSQDYADGATTMEARTGSQPLDPAAILTTIGTGGLPHQHGIIGRMVRNDEGLLVRVWGPDAPVSVIATLADDLDEATSQEAKIGAALSHGSDRGIVGGNWYVGGDRDQIGRTKGAGNQLGLRALSNGGYGRDEITDLYAVVIDGGVEEVTSAVARVNDVAERVSKGSFVSVFTATGSTTQRDDGLQAGQAAARVETALGANVIEGVAAGGFFLDVEVQTAEKISEDMVIEAAREVRAADGSPAFADVFPALAVSFARYC